MSPQESFPSSVADLAQLSRLWEDHSRKLLAMLRRRIDPRCPPASMRAGSMREQDHPRRRVVVKVIRQGHTSPEARERFPREQALRAHVTEAYVRAGVTDFRRCHP